MQKKQAPYCSASKNKIIFVYLFFPEQGEIFGLEPWQLLFNLRGDEMTTRSLQCLLCRNALLQAAFYYLTRVPHFAGWLGDWLISNRPLLPVFLLSSLLTLNTRTPTTQQGGRKGPGGRIGDEDVPPSHLVLLAGCELQPFVPHFGSMGPVLSCQLLFFFVASRLLVTAFSRSS